MESPSEVDAHETVGYGVAEGGAVGQQVQDRHALHAQGAVDKLRRKQGHDVEDVDRGPANEELEDHDPQHPNGAPPTSQHLP